MENNYMYVYTPNKLSILLQSVSRHGLQLEVSLFNALLHRFALHRSTLIIRYASLRSGTSIYFTRNGISRL